MYGAFKGFTAYEAYVWRFWIRIPYWRFIKVGCYPTIGFDTNKELFK